jgi:serine/threonine-protein kinase ULK/ATG1
MSDQWTTKVVDKYVVVNKKLGQGAYGVVYNGFMREDESRKVAVKTIPMKVPILPICRCWSHPPE